MKQTNEHELPKWLVEVINNTNNEYEKGEETDFSVTQLIKPPQIEVLEKRHPDTLEEDISGLLDSFIGTAVHNQIENSLQPDNDKAYMIEKRFYRPIRVRGRDYIISAQNDLYCLSKQGSRWPSTSLWDAKVTSVYKLKDGSSWEWEFQLNVQRWLIESDKSWYVEGGERIYGPHGKVDSLNIAGFAKDWRRGESKRSEDYPDVKFVPVHIPFWSDADVEATLEERIIEKLEAEKGNVRPCSPEERWATPTKYAHMRTGRKSAVALYENEDDAKTAVKDDPRGYVEIRPGANNRCEMGYCPVASVCNQFKLIQEGKWRDS